MTTTAAPISLGQLQLAVRLGATARTSGERCMPYRCRGLMAIVADRVGDQTPAGEASTADLIGAWIDAWQKADVNEALILAEWLRQRGIDSSESQALTVDQLMALPFRGPREGHIGETVFCEQWSAFVAGYGDDEYTPLEGVLGPDREVTLRRARVAASLVCWLGTNVGRGVLDEGELLRDKRLTHPFYLAWARFKASHRGWGSSQRAMEVLLAQDSDYGPTGIGWGITKPVHYTADDIEVVDAVMLWLSTSEGEAFIKRCETEISRRERERSATRRAVTSAGA